MKIYIIWIVLFISHLYATETDNYTYSDIDLEDSKEKINSIFNDDLDDIVFDLNVKLGGRFKDFTSISDTQIELSLSGIYLEKLGKDPFFHPYEECINHGVCRGVKIERILIRPNESIFSKYNPVATTFVASTINMCGVRFGVDKISHLLMDAFAFYNATKDKRFNISKEDVLKYSDALESGGYGTKFTGVYSYSDIEANRKGVDLFYDLFSGQKNYLVRDKKGRLKINKKVDLCDYVDKKFDERIEKSKLGDTSKSPAVKAAIDLATQDAEYRTKFFSQKQKDEFKKSILKRKYNEDLRKFNPLKVIEFAGMYLSDYSNSNIKRKGYHIMLAPLFNPILNNPFVGLEYRNPSNIQREIED
ncbi:MAG: hypothetical protein H6622_01000 [Halobacteriovoraceae bacterium]|nr:hypothetical protein [Halobacteriovoraceae bacterium]